MAQIIFKLFLEMRGESGILLGQTQMSEPRHCRENFVVIIDTEQMTVALLEGKLQDTC